MNHNKLHRDSTTAEMQGSELTLQARATGAYLGLAVGDALGATTEFLTPREIQERYGIHYNICGGGWLNLKPGRVTDDTQMSLALGQSIIDSQGVDAESVAQAFSKWMHSKPVDIDNTVKRGIIHFRNTGEPVVAESEYDAGNGACMRCLPIALYYWNATTEMLIEASRIQSHVTHNSRLADLGTEMVLQMLVSAFNGKQKEFLQQLLQGFVERYKAYRYDRRRIDNPSGWIVDTLLTVFQAFFTHDSFEAILIDVVNRGGDADTTGAIAGMLAGACYGRDNIPTQWLKTMDRDVIRACEKQSLELLALANRRNELH